MFKTDAVDSVANRYVDKNVGMGTPGTRLEEADRNIIQDELVKPVESSGQALDPTGVVRDQIARAMFIYGSAAQSLIDTGGAGAYVVDHVSANFVVPTAFAQIDGATAVFIPAVVNAGASTLDYMGLGAKTITDGAGSALTGGEMAGYVMLQYNLTSDRWEVVFAKFDDVVHGNRGGGSLHALAVAGVSAGFMSAADKTKLDGLGTGKFKSAAFTLTANIIQTFAHGLAATPSKAYLAARCKTAEKGYAINDWAFDLLLANVDSGPVNVRANSANVYFASGDSALWVIDQLASIAADWVPITPANWDLHLFVEV